MSSPIHKFLFSPPPSPPRRSLKSKSRSSPLTSHGFDNADSQEFKDHSAPARGGTFAALTSLKTLLLPDIHEHSYDSSDEDAYLSTRIPTPVQHVFELGPAMSSSTTTTSMSHGTTSGTDNRSAHSRSHTRQQSSIHSANGSTKRRQSMIVNVEDADSDSSVNADTELDIDATPRAPGRSQVLGLNNDTPILAPAPRRPTWRLSGPTPAPALYTPHRRNSSIPMNVPSSPLPRTLNAPVALTFARALANPSSLPRPVVRLLCLIAIATCSVLFLSQHPALVAEVPITLTRARGWGDSAIWPTGPSDPEWVPRQMKSDSMMKRAANPLTTRLTPSRPLPPTHELLALQSYLLQSERNVLPSHIDPSQPLDAHVLLPISPSEFSGTAWLRDLEAERAEDIVVWSVDPSSDTSIKVRQVLEEVHGKKKKVSAIALKGKGAVSEVLARLGHEGMRMNEKQGAMVVIGNEAIMASQVLHWSKSELEAKLKRIGWVAEKPREGIKRVLQQAKWKKAAEGEEEKKGKKGKK